MEQNLELEIKNKRKKQKRHKAWTKILGVMACIVVFCTTYALILPAITQETEVFCGNEAHTHEEACYEDVLICEQEVGEVHAHTDACYTQEKTLTCALAEAEAHTHDEACTVTERTLSCGQEESQGHTHSADCETVEKTLICALDENETHSHEDGCYETVTAYICGLEETEGHGHTDACYTETVTHTCSLEETEGHTHTDECYHVTEILACGLDGESTQGHVHGADCYEQQLVCELTEHEHILSCYSDPNADLETAAQWEATLPDELSGEYAVDVLSVARSQLGYTESTLNYEVMEDGESTKGYTRYGAWYGVPYGDWCAMFVSFCLNYAEVEGFPLDANCQNWIDTLQELEIMAYQEEPENSHEYYVSAENYEPAAGDIIFFNWDDSAESDHVGLVVEYIPATEHTTAQVKTIEGNSGNKVKFNTYEASDSSIMGYGILPQQYFYCGNTGHVCDSTCDEGCDLTHVHTDECLVPPAEEEAAVQEVLAYYCNQEEHTHGDECYDENGELICEIEEHTHTADCLVSPLHICGYVEHAHNDECYDENGELVCETEEHSHVVECFSDQKVGYVILEIELLPTYDEIMATMEEYEAAEDYEGEEAWYTKVVEQVTWAYEDYKLLTAAQQEQVYNAQKLLDLEFIWSVSTLIDDITSEAPNAIVSASTKDFIDLNLYDYDAGVNDNWNSNEDWPGFQWNGGAYHKTSATYNRHKIDFIDFGNSMITDLDYAGSDNGKATTAVDVGNHGGNINAIVEYPADDYANKPVGMSNGTDVLSRTLTTAGYPWVINAGSMVEYFSDSDFATKKNTSSIDGLFQINSTSGAYYYNSRWNHAQYSSNKFTLYEDIITPNFITYPFGNFLPLNDITDGSKATQVSKITNIGTYVQEVINDLWYDSSLRNQSTGVWYDSTASQLVDMLAKYRANLQSVTSGSGTAWSNWNAKQAIVDYIGATPTDDTSPITTSLLEKMYNIDWDVNTNFFFGMDMTMNFIQPKDGLTGYDNGNNTTGSWATNSNGDAYLTGTPDGISDYPMVFYFTGDDDVWVYIDGVLFLDLSGIHRHVGGEIDFVEGEVRYYALDTSTGDVSTTPYVIYTFAELLTAAGKSTDSLNSNGTFKNYTTHQFKFYYMERGSGSSVCRLNFNFPLLRQNSISVSKEVSSDTTVLGDPDYKFQILKADSSGNKTSEPFIAAGTNFDIYDENDNKIGTGTTDENGVFTLKAGQRAEFTGIEENAGKYYVRELLEGTVLEQYGNVTVSGESTTTSGSVTVGSETFTGMDSPVKDMSDGATAFRFTNDVDESKLGKLNISKQLVEYEKTRAATYYDIQVALDGELLPVGTTYTVGGEERTVETAGIISIAADETATIDNILAGTAFTVQETSGSAEGYTVTYTDSGGYTITVNDGMVSGVIKTSANVQLVVTNSEKGAAVTIPGTKSVANPDREKHTYTFQLDQVTDSTGTTLMENGIAEYQTTAEVTDTGQFTFSLTYAQVDMESLPAKFYYRITEVAGDDAGITTGYDDTVYVVEVTVSEATDEISAAVTNVWKDGEKLTDQTISFTNTLLSSLSLQKQVSGISGTNDEFTFTITLDPGESGAALPASYPAIFHQQDGTEQTVTVHLNDSNQIVLTGFKSGETAVIQGIPIGTKWTITETSADGYITSFTIDDGKENQTDNVSASIKQGGTTVVCTNTATYELPETGGSGTRMFTLLGAAFLLLGTITFFSLRRRERRTAQ